MPSSFERSPFRTLPFLSLLWTRSLSSFNRGLLKAALALLALAVPADAYLGPASRLALVFTCVLLPTLLLSGWAGWAADRFVKRKVMLTARVVEALALAAGAAALLGHSFAWLLAVLLLLSSADVFYYAAHLGQIPELLPESLISRANGLLEGAAYTALVLGLALGGLVYAKFQPDLSFLPLLLLPMSGLALVFALGLPRQEAAQPDIPLRPNPFTGLGRGLAVLWRDPTLRVSALGRAYFGLSSGFLQMAGLMYIYKSLSLSPTQTGLALALLALGAGLGSLAAGQLSGKKVDIGLVPMGSVVSGAAVLALPLLNSFPLIGLMLVLVGFGGGLFLVPCTSLMLQRIPARHKGRLAAASAFLDTAALITSSLAFVALDRMGAAPWAMLVATGVVTLSASIYLLLRVPAMVIRAILFILTHTFYRLRVRGDEHVPFRGPVLLVCNHISHIDGLLVGAATQRFIRFTVAKPEFSFPGLGWLFKLMKAIPVEDSDPALQEESIQRIRRELAEGHTVCVFAEGAISRTGYLLPFSGNLERILEGMPHVPVVPTCVEGLWASLFAFSGEKFLWHWPDRYPSPVSVTFGTPLPSSTPARLVRQAVLELSADTSHDRIGPNDLLHWQYIRTARRNLFRFHMGDASGKRLTFLKSLAGSLAMSRWVRRRCPDQKMVGLILPATIAGAVANQAVTMAGKVPVNLNFTAGPEAMRSAMRQCGIKTVLTSPAVLEKLNIPRFEEMVFLEDAMKEMGKAGPLLAAAAALLLPWRAIRRIYCPEPGNPEDLATVIFSSGSTGTPKGVMLSHRNIICDIRASEQIIWVTHHDTILGILPFFHSFGFTVTIWFPALAGFGVAFHPSPVDTKAIDDLMRQYKATIIISTPTFYGHYIRKCNTDDWASLRFAVAGAEKLRQATATAFREKFGQNLFEGYGCTELSPIVSVNVWDVTTPRGTQVGLRPGSVGHPLPGVCARIVDPDTRMELPAGASGMVEVKGPTLMMGYLHQPAKTAEVVRDGWYMTGDIGYLDDHGFLHLTDRLFRFSKIGGEMVPHIKIEETLQVAFPEDGLAVTAVPDEAKGERLVVLFTHPDRNPEEYWGVLNQGGLPKLWIPKREHFYRVEAIPVLGTGKADLREIKRLALQRAGLAAPPAKA